MKKQVFAALGLLLTLCAVKQIAAQKALPVTVSIAPQKYFINKIGGELVDVTVMVPAGAGPHTFEPKPRQLVKLAKSKIYFAIGLTFESIWLDRFRAVNPDMHIVHTDDGIDKIPMKPGKKNVSAGHAKHSLRHDPHIWLSPKLVLEQADHIFRALAGEDPSNSEIFRRNYDRFVRELSSLDAELRNIFDSSGERVKFMVFHPTWGYFADAYGLEQIPVEMEGKEPKPADLAGLIDKAKTLGIRAVFVQPQFSSKSAETIAKAIGGEIIFADPLSEDWEENLRKTAIKFKSALR